MSYLPLLEAAVTGALAADADSQEHHQLVRDEKRWAHRVKIINQEMVEDALRRENLTKAYGTLQRAEANHTRVMNDIARGTAVLPQTQSGKVLVTVDNKHASIRRIPYRVINTPPRHHHHHHNVTTSTTGHSYATHHLVSKHHQHHHHVL